MAILSADFRQIREESLLLNGSSGEGQAGNAEQPDTEVAVDEEGEVEMLEWVEKLEVSLLE